MFDDKIEPWLKERYDHGMLINIHDPLYATLRDHMERTGESFRLKLFNGPTSVENLAFMLFTEITNMGFTLRNLEIRETDTSVVRYSHEDWQHELSTAFRTASPCDLSMETPLSVSRH